MRLLALLPVLLSAAVPAASWKVTTYNDDNCSDQVIETLESTVGTECKSMEGIGSFKLEDTGDATLFFWNFEKCYSPDDDEYRGSIQQPDGCVSKARLLSATPDRWNGDGGRSWRIQAPRSVGLEA